MSTSPGVSPTSDAREWGRVAETELLSEFLRARAATGMSQRAFAEAHDVPRTTLQDWLYRKERLELPPEAVAFFESPAGLVFLHRLVVASHLVMNWLGTCGIRMVGQFVELCGLGPVLASSYGVHQEVSAEMQAALVEYGKQERAKLGLAMPHRQITVCEDETFLSSGVCLVAIEPVSGFALAEQYAEQRDAETWNAAVKDATKGLDVEVVQSTADEAQALARHARDMDAHHSPDLFHVQNEVNQALVLPLLRQRHRAEEVLDATAEATKRHIDERNDYWSGPRGRGRPPDFEGRIREALAAHAAASADAEASAVRWQEWQSAVRDLAVLYHPYDLETGAPRSAEMLAAELDTRFDRLRRTAHEAAVSERSLAGIEKAARVAPKMVDTLRFFHDSVRERIESLALPAPLEEAMQTLLVPAAYLSRVIEREDRAEQRALLRETLQRLLTTVHAPDGPLATLDTVSRRRTERAAFDCADIFQRASSCVEGRNGRLSQWEHAQRRLSPKKLEGITVVHNYFIKRSDGTTAAERFFRSKPSDLFAWLLDHIHSPARPASKRPAQEKSLLVQPA